MRVIQAARDEFSEYGFDLSSIQRIIEAAGISRGSFYQYFEDKHVLFALVIKEMSERKIEFLTPVLSMEKDLTFFDYVKLLFKQGMLFGSKNPQDMKIALDVEVSRTLNNEKLREIIYAAPMFHHTITLDANTFYLNLIKNAIKRGELTDTYPAETINLYLITFLEGLRKQLFYQNISDPFGEAGEKIVGDFISILKHGFCGPECK